VLLGQYRCVQLFRVRSGFVFGHHRRLVFEHLHQLCCGYFRSFRGCFSVRELRVRPVLDGKRRCCLEQLPQLRCGAVRSRSGNVLLRAMRSWRLLFNCRVGYVFKLCSLPFGGIRVGTNLHCMHGLWCRALFDNHRCAGINKLHRLRGR
jgi:hypothetical protein